MLRPWTGKAKCTKYRRDVKGLSKTALYRDQGQKYEDFLRRMSVITGVSEGKKPAKILYEKCGFVRAGKTEPMWIYTGDDH